MSRFNLRPLFGKAPHVTLASLFVACGGASVWKIEAAQQQPISTDSAFILLADTQYAVPFTDYDVRYQLGSGVVSLPPTTTTRFARSFYRNAESHFAVPLATDAILTKEEAGPEKPSFGLFGGDMAELSCKNEAQSMFAALERHPRVPFIVTIGNHDATFHGSYDTDAIGESGQGPWDTYSFALWGHTCEGADGRLTKTGFIRQLLAYYEKVWQVDFRTSLSLPKSALDGGVDAGAITGAVDSFEDLPRGTELTGVVHPASPAGESWDLEFSLRLGAEDSPQSHRQSHFFQRWARKDPQTKKANLAITVLDTTDFGSRRVLCDLESSLVQIGLAGGITNAQVSWLESLNPVSGQKLVLSHYIPFQSIDGIDPCETTFGTSCLGARLRKVLGDSTYIYAHVHKPFEAESIEIGAPKPNPGLTTADGGAPKTAPAPSAPPATANETCEATATPPKFPENATRLIRLPSLIDNKQYVVFSRGQFKGVLLSDCSSANSPPDALASVEPFTMTCDTCTQRFLEYTELVRNLSCLKLAAGDCPDLKQALSRALTEAPSLCQNGAADWLKTNAETGVGQACTQTEASEKWRCILRNLTAKLLPEGAVSQKQRADAGLRILAVSQPLPGSCIDSTAPAATQKPATPPPIVRTSKPATTAKVR